MAQVAFTAGFASIRACNDTVRVAFGSSPTQLRLRWSVRFNGHHPRP